MLWRQRVEDSLDGRVKALADRYIAKGDFWEFLNAVNEDYKAHAIERAEEEMNAKTFIRIVLERREKERERTLQVDRGQSTIFHVSLLCNSNGT